MKDMSNLPAMSDVMHEAETAGKPYVGSTGTGFTGNVRLVDKSYATKWWDSDELTMYPYTADPDSFCSPIFVAAKFMKDAARLNTPVYSVKRNGLTLNLPPEDLNKKLNEYAHLLHIHSDKDGIRYTFHTENVFMEYYYTFLSKTLTYSLITLDKISYDNLVRVITESTDQKNKVKHSYIYVVSKGEGGGLELDQLGKVNNVFVPENYTPEVIAQYNHIVADLNSKTPCGKLVIFRGSPGTGKSFCMKGMITGNPDLKFVLLPVSMMEDVTQPSLISLFLQVKRELEDEIRINESDTQPIKRLVFVIEDADYLLVKRGGDNLSILSNLLNVSDGIFGDALDFRVIATTNAEKFTMDKAVMRTGRLCTNVEFSKLNQEHALKILDRLVLNTQDTDLINRASNAIMGVQSLSLSDIYALAAGKNIAPEQDSKGFGFSK